MKQARLIDTLFVAFDPCMLFCQHDSYGKYIAM